MSASISSPFIRRPIATSLLMVFICMCGIVAFQRLSVASLPSIDLPTIRVQAFLPGASPETMATSVAMPLERQLGQLSGVTELTSSNVLGSSTIMVQFSLDRDVDGAARDVQSAINAAQPSLPADMPNPPTYRKSNPVLAPVLVLAVTSDTLPPGQLFDYADSVIAQKLSQVEGVGEVIINGSEKSAVRVQANPRQLAAMGLSLADLRQAIHAGTVESPKGSLNGPDQTWSVGAEAQLFGAEAYRKLIIAGRDGTPVRLEDVARVVDGVSNTRLAGWFGERRAVIVLILRQPKANLIDTIDRVRAALPGLGEWLPKSVDVAVLSDRSASIRASIYHVMESLGLAVVLVIMSIFLFLRRLWATVIPSVAIPVAILGTFAVMYLLGFGLNNLSLMALTVATGFVVDDAIVMIENITRLQEKGMRTFEAALEGARQIGFTIVSITLSLIAVFIPVLFMGGIVGRFFQNFGVTLSIAVVISAFVSLTLTPMMCARMLETPTEHKPGRLERWLERGFAGLQGGYERGLDFVLRHRRMTLAVTVLTAVLTIWLYGVVPKGFFPPQDNIVVNAYTDAPADISFEAMAQRQREAQAIIMADPAVASVTSFVGSGGQNSGRFIINLTPRDQRDLSSEQVIERLRRPLRKLIGISVYMQPASDFMMGARTTKGRYQYTLLDEDYTKLQQFTPVLLEALRTSSNLTDLNSDQDAGGLQLSLKIDRDSASRLGVPIQAIDDALYDAFGQRQVATMYTPLNQYYVVLEVDPKLQTDPSMLQAIRVPTADGRQIPLSALAHFEPAQTPLTITHQGQFPAATISFSPKPGVALSAAVDEINKTVSQLRMPETMRGEFAGDAKAFKQNSGDQLIVLLAAILVVYIVLGVLYESTVHPLTILSAIPSAGLGALLALLITHIDFSPFAMIGIILLVGIVKKNAIMMVDFALEAERHQGLAPLDAIRLACVVRFRPIMMTTLAALLAALPLALDSGQGGELRRSLGVTVLGGLVVSQILTLFTTPVVYLALDRLRYLGRRRRVPTQPTIALPAS